MIPWESSESTAAIVPAFVVALGATGDVVTNKRANIETKSGSRVQYAYADLAAVLDELKPVLASNGLAVSQSASDNGVQTILLHSSGEWLAFPPLNIHTGQNTPQAQGSAISFARRYALLAAFNIATEDDDGQTAAKTAPVGRKPRQTTPPADATEPAAASAPAPNTITDRQHRMLMALLTGAGLKEHDEYCAYISDVIGRKVDSSKAITVAEGSAVIDALKAGGA